MYITAGNTVGALKGKFIPLAIPVGIREYWYIRVYIKLTKALVAHIPIIPTAIAFQQLAASKKSTSRATLQPKSLPKSSNIATANNIRTTTQPGPADNKLSILLRQQHNTMYGMNHLLIYTLGMQI